MLDKQILIEMQEYVQQHLQEHLLIVMQPSDCLECQFELCNSEIEDYIESNLKPTFKQLLFGYIDRSGLSDPEVYNRAGIDRKHFSKIRSNPNYNPRKNTIIALALALELTRKETDTLLNSASYSLSESNTFDLVVQFCIEKKIYNIYDVNQALDYFSQDSLVGTHP